MICMLTIRVSPGSRRQAIERDRAGTIKVFLIQKAEHGAANKALVKYLSEMLKIPQAHIIIAQGLTARTKLLKITTDLSYNQILMKLGLEVQHALI